MSRSPYGSCPRLALLHNRLSTMQASLQSLQLQEEKETPHEKERRKDYPAPEADHQPNGQDHKRGEVVVVPGGVEVPNMYLGSSQSEGRRLLLDFLEQFLLVKITGFQNCWGFRPDLILFEHPTTKTTLAVDTDTMLLPMAQARQLVQSRIAASSIAFGIERGSFNEFPGRRSSQDDGTALLKGEKLAVPSVAVAAI